MMVRTEQATVTRLAGTKGVGIEEVRKGPEGREFKQRATVWLGEMHGLQVGDSARFLGRLVLKIKPGPEGPKTYVDLEISDATVVEGTLVAKPVEAAEAAWDAVEPGAGWAK